MYVFEDGVLGKPEVQLRNNHTKEEFNRRGWTYSRSTASATGKLVFDNYYFRLVEEEDGFMRLFIFAEEDLEKQFLSLRNFTEDEMRDAAKHAGLCFGLAENVRINLRPARRTPHPNMKVEGNTK